MHDRVIVDNMSGNKTQQARLPADYGLYNSTFPKPGQLHLDHSRVSKR